MCSITFFIFNISPTSRLWDTRWEYFYRVAFLGLLGEKTMTDPHIGFRFASAGDAAGGFSSLFLGELSVGLIRF